MSRARVILAGNNLAARLVLDLLLEALDPADVLVLAPPGGAHHAWQPSLAGHAHALGLRCIEPEDVNSPEAVAQLEAHGASLMLSVYYTQLFRDEVLAAVRGPALNFHPSLLPRHRGVAPLIWAIAEGDRATGLSVHHVDRGVDTGRLVWQRSLPIHPDDTGYELHLKMAAMVRAAAASLLRGWLAGDGLPDPWDQAGRASSHSLRDPSLNHLDFATERARVRDVVRALAPPLPGAFCLARGERLPLSRVEPVAGNGRDSLVKTPGMLEYLPGRVPVVWCADGPLRIDEFAHDGSPRRGTELHALTGLREGDLLT